MITITFQIPDEIAQFLRDKKNVEPKTYFQNEVIEPIISDYEKNIKSDELVKLQDAVSLKVGKIKTDMKVIITDEEKKRK
jgi:hypothetical protein